MVFWNNDVGVSEFSHLIHHRYGVGTGCADDTTRILTVDGLKLAGQFSVQLLIRSIGVRKMSSVPFYRKTPHQDAGRILVGCQ